MAGCAFVNWIRPFSQGFAESVFLGPVIFNVITNMIASTAKTEINTISLLPAKNVCSVEAVEPRVELADETAAALAIPFEEWLGPEELPLLGERKTSAPLSNG